jgi:GT2 family glycosyltransferase
VSAAAQPGGRRRPGEVLVSVVVPVRNSADGLERLIERLAAQSLAREDFEVIIADDGSSDASSRRLAADGKWLRVTWGPRRNSYAARNRGVQLARGPILAFTDADCLPRADWLEAGLAALQSSDLVAGHIELLLPERPTAWAIIDATLFDQERFVTMGKAATANMFMSRALFAKYGGFDATLPSGGDWDFIERSVQGGARLTYTPDAIVEHPTRSRAGDFLRRRWRIEQACAMRLTRAGQPLLALNKTREPVVPRRWGFVVGYDRPRMAAVGLSTGWRSYLITAPARYVIVPAVDALAQIVGWLRCTTRRNRPTKHVPT